MVSQSNNSSEQLKIKNQLDREGLQASVWSNDPGAVYASHDHSYGKILVVASGSITFKLVNDQRNVLLKAGDRLALPAGTLHSAIVGPQGVVCYEAQLDKSDDRVKKVHVENTP